jgi:hypothetical protein
VENAISLDAPMPSVSSRHKTQSTPPLHPQLFPSAASCASCGVELTEPYKRELGNDIHVHTHEHGPLLCSVYKRSCSDPKCGTQHHYSFNSHPNGSCTLANGALEQEYLLLFGTHGGNGAYGAQIKLLDYQRSNVTNGHLTFDACSKSYNDVYCADGARKLDVHVLTDYYFSLNSLRYLKVLQCLEGLDIRRLVTREARRKSMDDFLLDVLPVLKVSFSRYWSLHPFRLGIENKPLQEASFALVEDSSAHPLMDSEKAVGFAFSLMPLLNPDDIRRADERPSEYGCGPGCSHTMTVDGHFKVHRPTCQREQACVRHSPELPALRLQCPNRPM